MSDRLLLARGFTFTHDRMLDTTWHPGPGQKYTDAPKVTMVVTRTSRYSVWYNTQGEGRRKTASWVMDRTEFIDRFMGGTP